MEARRAETRLAIWKLAGLGSREPGRPLGGRCAQPILKLHKQAGQAVKATQSCRDRCTSSCGHAPDDAMGQELSCIANLVEHRTRSRLYDAYRYQRASVGAIGLGRHGR